MRKEYRYMVWISAQDDPPEPYYYYETRSEAVQVAKELRETGRAGLKITIQKLTKQQAEEYN